MSEQATPDDGEGSVVESTTAVSSTSAPSDLTKRAGKGDKEESSTLSKDGSITGKINNMISADINTLEAGQTFILVSA